MVEQQHRTCVLLLPVKGAGRQQAEPALVADGVTKYICGPWPRRTLPASRRGASAEKRG